jgi:hypothetical protein
LWDDSAWWASKQRWAIPADVNDLARRIVGAIDIYWSTGFRAASRLLDELGKREC